VEVAPDKTSVVSVYDGTAAVAARGAEVQVPLDHGTFVKNGPRPAPPRPLPPRPRWSRGTGDMVVLVPPGHRGAFTAHWHAVKSARRYRVELARDARFKVPIVDAVVGAGILQFEARDLKPATYHARVAAIDGARLEGRPSKTIQVRVLPLRASRKLLRRQQDRTFEAVGLLRVEPREEAEKVEVSLDGGAYERATAPVRLSRPGLHRLRYRPLGGKATTELRIRLLAVKGKLAPPADPLKPESPPALVALQVKDERGRAAILPDLSIKAYPGGELPLRYAGPGRYEVQLGYPEQPRPSRIWLVAAWLGGELGRTEVQVQAPPEPPPPPKPAPPPGFRWPSEPLAPEGALPVPGLPPRAARPTTALGLSSFFARSGTEGDPLQLRLALRAGLAILDRRLGVDLDLPFLHMPLNQDRAGTTDLGDLRVGARYLALDRWGLALSPSLRVTVPTGRDLPRSRRPVLLEPALLAEWTFRDLLTLGSNQVLVLDLHTDQGTAVHYAGTYSAEVFLLSRHLGLAAELDTLFSIHTPDAMPSLTAVAASGGLRAYLGRVRLGLVGGGGITDDARQVLGQFTAGLTVDLGFLWP
jgi:hypothetical protein